VVRTRLDVLVVKHVVVRQPVMLETVPLRTGLRVLSISESSSAFMEEVQSRGGHTMCISSSLTGIEDEYLKNVVIDGIMRSKAGYTHRTRFSDESAAHTLGQGRTLEGK
jgi:hypothetical protein